MGVHFLQENTKSIEILILTEKSLWCFTEDQMFLISHDCIIKALTTDLRERNLSAVLSVVSLTTDLCTINSKKEQPYDN